MLMINHGQDGEGCYGRYQFDPPNMDRLADEGVKFLDH